MASKSWTIDSAASAVSFNVQKLGFLTVKGSIAALDGTLTFSKEAPDQSNFEVSLSPAVIQTGHAKRDEHLRSKDFFHVNDFPKIQFVSTSVQAVDNDYQVTGRLSMLGVTKTVVIPFSFSAGDFVGQFSINRLDYQLGAKFPAFFIGKTIQIQINCKTINA